MKRPTNPTRSIKSHFTSTSQIGRASCREIEKRSDGIRDTSVTGVQTCALPILNSHAGRYGSYGGFSLKKQLAIVVLVSLAVFVAMAQVAPAIAEHQGHETSDEPNEVHQVTFHIDLTDRKSVV